MPILKMDNDVLLKTGREPLEPVDELGPNSVPDNGLLFIEMVCYTEIIIK